jgi:hypothetical protein
LEKLGFGENKVKLVNDDWMMTSQSATTLYIYRVEGLALQIASYNSDSS